MYLVLWVVMHKYHVTYIYSLWKWYIFGNKMFDSYLVLLTVSFQFF